MNSNSNSDSDSDSDSGLDSDFLPLPLGEGRGEGYWCWELCLKLPNISLVNIARAAVCAERGLFIKMGFMDRTLNNLASKDEWIKKMAKKFSDLRAGMGLAARERCDVKAKVLLAKMPLNELQQARGLPQKKLTDELDAQQSSNGKFEKRTNMN